MTDTQPELTHPVESAGNRGAGVARFSLSQRIEHAVLLTSFTILGITGLAQKYAFSALGEGVLGIFGGIEGSRLVHRGAAIALMAVSIYHVVAVLYRVLVLRYSLSMLPVLDDFRHLVQDILYYVGRRSRRAFYGRYTYAEKMEYLAVVWGTLIMAVTGFMMWNPIATTNYLPGEYIPAAKAAHGGEALLAVLSILLWHFYHVHIRTFNKSMFTGKLSLEEMQHEHPAELALIEAGKAGLRPSPQVIQKRQRLFFPIAALLLLIGGYGLWKFVNFEQTAITTVPRGETAEVFVPITATPAPTQPPTPTPTPGEVIQANTWEGGIFQLVQARCGGCHVQGEMGGLSLASYAAALEGGPSGPAIVPGDPEASVLVQVQTAGGHPGQFHEEELALIIEWITAGAVEK